METVDEFMARFRATGLDMLCEAQRRAEQTIPWTWGAPVQRSWASPYASFQQIPKNSFFEQYMTRPDPAWTFIDIDRDVVLGDVTVTGRMEVNVNDRILHNALDQQRELFVMKGRACGLSYQRQALAAAITADSMGRVVLDFEALEHSFGIANQSLNDWVRSFGVNPYGPKVQPQTLVRSLGPGKEVEAPGERRVNPKRVAKDRLKRKIARKSKRK